jgi:hypothetical protein
MSKRQAILATLLGATQLNGNQTVADRIRTDILKISNPRYADGYQRLARAAFEPRRERRKAA